MAFLKITVECHGNSFHTTASIVSLLRSLGLTKYEMLVYITLLKDGPKDCKSLIRLASVPSGKIYLVVKKLTEKGWIVSSTNERPKIFYAVDPEIAIKKRISELKHKLNLLERSASTVSSILKPVYARLPFTYDSIQHRNV